MNSSRQYFRQDCESGPYYELDNKLKNGFFRQTHRLNATTMGLFEDFMDCWREYASYAWKAIFAYAFRIGLRMATGTLSESVTASGAILAALSTWRGNFQGLDIVQYVPRVVF